MHKNHTIDCTDITFNAMRAKYEYLFNETRCWFINQRTS